MNKAHRTKEIMYNTEFVPGENLGVKNANWDREDGYFVPRDIYNSYFYIVENEDMSILEKIRLHGKKMTSKLDGGSAAHLNLDEHLSKIQYRYLLEYAGQEECPYLTFNIPNTVCNECGYRSKRYLKNGCPECGSKDVDFLTRIIGYLKRISSFSQPRQEEAGRRYYSHGDKVHNNESSFPRDSR